MRFTKFIQRCALGGAIASFGVTACGGGANPNQVQGSLEAPRPRDARVALTPALDVSTLYDPSIAARLVVDDIEINVSDARLLGADPRIPTGGLSLMNGGRVLITDGGSYASTELPFPNELLGEGDLAVYVRFEKTEELQGASVIVHARVYSGPVKGQPLTAAPDPDGDPADKGGTAAQNNDTKLSRRVAKSDAPDPDGDPARCAPDPDGDPASPKCIRSQRRFLKAATTPDGNFVRVELRGSDAADLVAALGSKSALDVIIGIPASRWLTKDTMARIDTALADSASQSSTNDENADAHNGGHIIVGSTSDHAAAAKDRMDGMPGDDSSGYRLLEEMAAGRLKIYR